MSAHTPNNDAEQPNENQIMLILSAPPSLNALWITPPHYKRRIRSPKYNAWRHTAGWELKSQFAGMKPLDCRYDMLIEVPISRRDTGNHEKAIGDLLEACGVVSNDGNCHRLTVHPTDRTDCLVVLTPLPEMGDIRKPVAPRPIGAVVRKPRATSSQIARFEKGRARRLL